MALLGYRLEKESPGIRFPQIVDMIMKELRSKHENFFSVVSTNDNNLMQPTRKSSISITLNNGKVITCTHTKSIGHTLICNNGFYQDEIPIETIKIVNDTEYGDYKPFISKNSLRN